MRRDRLSVRSFVRGRQNGDWEHLTMASASENQGKTISYRYTFMLGAGRDRTFDLRLDKSTLNLRTAQPETPPEWTSLECCKCPNCPLSEEDHPHCPIAVNITDLVSFFTDAASYDKIDVQIATDERTYMKQTTATEAVSSLLGIYMVTSGCPIMDKIRPMVRFHLPLATQEETTFRAMAMYLVAQYFVYKRGGKPDWDLNHLPAIYREIQTVNGAFTKRLRETATKDANTNALIRLDAFASIIVMSFDLNQLDGIEALFSSYQP